MRHPHLPERFTWIGADEEGREYIQCTRTGDVLVQTGTDEWRHFASAREWRSRTAAQLYPELIYLERALKRVGSHETIDEQLARLKEATAVLNRLLSSIQDRVALLETKRDEVEQVPTPAVH